MKKKTSFLRFIRFWTIITILIIGGSMVALDVATFYQNFHSHVDQLRADYTDRQKQIIKQEVDQVIDLIRTKIARTDELTRNNIKSRVYEAYAVAQNIYQENKTVKSAYEIQKMIIDALRPIRFEQGNGYYFVTRLDGVEILFADKPELEGKNLLDMQDTQGRYVIKDMIQITKQSGEGFYDYLRTKPDAKGNDFKKIAFIKRFEPYDWFVGTGLYVDDVENQIKADLLADISRIRFEKEGYIFVNRLNGDVLVSNGKLFSGTKKLWEVFDENPEKMKSIFEKEYAAALKPKGDYIYYSHIKLTDPTKESPKASFIYGIPELQWLIGAGVYLDDVEAVIIRMQTEENNQIKMRILYDALIIMGIVVFLLFLFSWLHSRLKKDFILFISFFNRAAFSDDPIDRGLVRFDELDRMAKNANLMLANRRQTEAALRKNEEKYRLIAENMSDVISVMDMNLRFTYVSPSITRLTGFSVEESMKYSIEEIMTPESFKKVMQAFEEEIMIEASGTADSSRTRIIEFEQNKKDLAIVWVEASCSFIRDKEQKPTEILVISRDITERKKSADGLRESEEKYRKILENIDDGYIEVDIAGNITFFNDSLCRIFGFSRDKLLGMNYRENMDEENAQKIYQMFNKVYQTGISAKASEWRFTRKDGSDCIVEIVVSLITDLSNKGIGFRGIARDITNRKQLEAQLQQAQKMESVGRLAGGMAHDYNNALAVIIGFTEMAIDDVAPDSTLRDDLNEVLKAARRAEDITRQLLAFARKQTIAPTLLDLNDNVEGMLKMLRRLIGEDIDLIWSPGASLGSVNMDPSQVDQILANLCVNARDAIDGVGKVNIETQNVTLDEAYCANHPGFVPGEFVLLVVSDNGCGMDKETLDNIFEPFFTTKEVGKGTGLGMSTVYGIAKQNNGFVNAYSEPGNGTTIRIYLPRHEGKAAGTQDKSTAEIPQGRGETILVVEDDLPILNLAEKILAGLGYAVLIANTAEAAMDLAAEHAGEIDLLITDVIMPEMNGRDLAHQLQSLYPDLKSIFMSGYTADIIARRGILDDGVHFIQKPFSRRELAIIVRKSLDNEG